MAVRGDDTTSWDSHRQLTRVMGDHLLPGLDRSLPPFLLDLEERGMLEDTLVIVCGEIGRTPRAYLIEAQPMDEITGLTASQPCGWCRNSIWCDFRQVGQTMPPHRNSQRRRLAGRHCCHNLQSHGDLFRNETPRASGASCSDC